MRAMKDSGIEWIGEVPEKWQIHRARNHFLQSFSKGNSILQLLSATQAEGVVPKDTVEGVVQVKEDADLSQFKTVHKYDYVISLRSFQGGFEMSEHEGVITPAYSVFRTRNQINHSFFKRLFKCDGFIGKINSLTVGIREGKNILYDDFSDVLLPIPPLADQQRIADFLDNKCSQIDSIIEKQKLVIEKLKQYKQSIITEAVTKGLNPTVKMKPSGIEWIGDIPEGWEFSRIKYIVDFNPRYEDSFPSATEVSFSPMEYIGQGKMSSINSAIDKVKNGYTYFANGDIVMAKVTPCFENGNIAIAENLTNGVGFGSTELYVFRCTKVNEKFFFYFLQNQSFVGKCISSMYGTGGLKRVSTDTVSNYKLVLPPIGEQKMIADHLDSKCASIDNIIDGKQKIIDKLTDYKKSLIYECVTGKREVV